MSKQHILVISLGFMLGLAASACEGNLVVDPSHCRNAGGDSICAELYHEARRYCTSDACDGSSKGFHGCVAERPNDDCYYPCDGDNNFTDDHSCLTASGDESDGDGDMMEAGDDGMTQGDGDGETPCTGPADCTNGAAPFCDGDGVCVGCEGMEDADLACAGLDPELAVCQANVCVACTPEKSDACVETTPICDSQSNACVACSDHDQCPDSACNLVVGNCFDPSNTLHVDGDGGNCGDADGSQTAPYCELGDALSNAAAEALIILHERDGDQEYQEANEIKDTIALIAADGESPVLKGDNGDAPLSVTPSGLLFVRGVEISHTANGGLGLEVSGGQAWVEQCKIVDNRGGGILVDDGGVLMLENSFVGGEVTDKAAIEVIDGEASVVFSTLAAGDGDDSRALRCADGSDVTIRNSILVSVGAKPEIDCPSLEPADSFTEANASLSFDLDSDWFVDFGEGDFHLAPGIYPDAIATSASWQPGDPTTDIDGDARPTDATPDFAGADRSP